MSVGFILLIPTLLTILADQTKIHDEDEDADADEITHNIWPAVHYSALPVVSDEWQSVE